MSRPAPDYDVALLEHGLSLTSRKINAFGEVDDTMAERVLSGLDILNRKSTAPITIVLNTYGGDVTAGFAIFDAIRLSEAPVNVLATGALFSMGAVIMQAAHQGRRVVTENCTLMLHYGSEQYDGDSLSFLSWANHGKYVQKRFCEILAAQTGKSAVFWKRRLQADLVLTAKEAKKLCLIDHILEP